ncbi:hypothetical protein [Actinotignum schaalii]|uniref:hypothetical protein n=1 Tax=Actinotignum schaalii TaxID=59505 RepID=UPI0004D0DC7A|nr:hypothetical protein [Actinotignum schaalii]AIE82950.1 hypothetical protein FB03_06470 [Actinotignum schaalii]WQN45092.1 hypothetical protein U4A90_08930 [Actinotignum schaalii]
MSIIHKYPNTLRVISTIGALAMILISAYGVNLTLELMDRTEHGTAITTFFAALMGLLPLPTLIGLWHLFRLTLRGVHRHTNTPAHLRIIVHALYVQSFYLIAVPLLVGILIREGNGVTMLLMVISVACCLGLARYFKRMSIAASRDTQELQERQVTTT